MRGLYLLFLITVALLPVQFALNPTTSIDLPFYRVIVPLLFLGVLFYALFHKKKIHLTLAVVTLCVFLFTAALSLILHEDVSWGMRKALFLFSLVPLIFVTHFFCVYIAQGHVMITKALVGGAVGAALIGVVQFSLQFIIGLDPALDLWRAIVGFFLGHNLGEAVLTHSSWLVNVAGATLFRVSAFFPDPHIAAFYFGMSAPFALWLFMREKKYIWLVACGVLIIADLLTFSRGGAVALFSGAGIFLFLMRGTVSQGARVLLYGAGATIFLMCIVPNPVSQRFVSSFDLDEGSNIERLHNWQQAADIIIQHPLIGVGLGNYARTVLPSASYRDPIYAHNLYLDITAELGVSGLIAWLLFVSTALLLFLRRNDFFGMMGIVSMSIFSIHSIFETALFSTHIFSLLLIIVALAYEQHVEKK